MAEKGASRPIEDYALIGNLSTAALIGRDGAVDWLCPPRFDAAACFAALLGDDGNGCWRLAPADGHATRRRYLPDTLVLETVHETAEGAVEVIDFMPYSGTDGTTDLVRLVRGRSGRVEMTTEIVLRFDYGSIVPWVRHGDGGMHAIGGPDAVVIRTPVPLKGADFRTRGRFTVAAGETVPFVLTCFRSHLPEPEAIDPEARLEETVDWWRQWTGQCSYQGPWRDAGGALAHHAEGADPCGDRRDRRGADDLAARGDRRRAQLGLPLLLGAGRDLHPLRAGEVGLPRRGGGLAAVAAPGGGGLARADAAALRHRRRAAAARARAALAPGLCRQPAGPGRQPGADPGAARRARRDDGRAARRARRTSSTRSTTPGGCR